MGIEETVKKGAAGIHMPGHIRLCVQQPGNYTPDAICASPTFEILCTVRNLSLEGFGSPLAPLEKDVFSQRSGIHIDGKRPTITFGSSLQISRSQGRFADYMSK